MHHNFCPILFLLKHISFKLCSLSSRYAESDPSNSFKEKICCESSFIECWMVKDIMMYGSCKTENKTVAQGIITHKGASPAHKPVTNLINGDTLNKLIKK